jgi:hypothetical protein
LSASQKVLHSFAGSVPATFPYFGPTLFFIWSKASNPILWVQGFALQNKPGRGLGKGFIGKKLTIEDLKKSRTFFVAFSPKSAHSKRELSNSLRFSHNLPM